ncbi:acyltransferase [Streptomyces resistomycificus]|uniref:Acetyltransferase n=1 Tax=Streptomyces resistomycificus TaxID=67356 RepID=A0A0L8L8M9_9ACTN|nr:acyltransferase [Streptomyces resistomycificus]KOG34474.1 acetyltransferase [Streptomyces resistomycificus]KUO00679.1 acetyltransferase [Streptomyces resistomycificus]
MDQHQQQDVRRFDHCPWLFADEAAEEQRVAQRERQREIGGDSEVGERCYVAESAAVFPDLLRLGDDSYIAAHAYVTGELTTGSDCTLNPYAIVRGTVSLGNGVRVGAHTSLLGFNHSMAPDRPVFQQPLTSRGITIGDDVWIGSHVVVVDGVTIGDHCVIGAGAVVTKDLPAWTVAAGNPARPLRDRRGATAPLAAHGADPLTRFADTARAQAAEVLARCWDGNRYVDRPGATPTVRAHCDAVEIADLLLGSVPEQLTADEHGRRLCAAQAPDTGLTPELGKPLPTPDDDGFIGDGPALYHILSVGYALDLLGASFPHPVRGAAKMTAGELITRLEGLPWRDGAWEAGAWIDAWATAAHWNLRHTGDGGVQPGTLEALFGWLLTRADPWTGMWGSPSPETGRLQIVNGYYRLTRGSFAQFGLPVPHPERVVDAVLDHARDSRYFGGDRDNACNVLDVVHPLWLCTRQLGTGSRHQGYRLADIRAWAERQLAAILPRWQNGRGFGFGCGPTGPGPQPGLQGTEMWLAIIWYLADLLGRADALGYRPRGIHRPEPSRSFEPDHRVDRS